MPDRPPQQRPTRRLRLGGVLWLAWGLAGCAVLAGSAVLLAERIHLPGTRVVGGTLRPDRDPTVIALPAGLPLARVLVAPGDPVRAGQTLALYDRAMIGAELARLERAVIATGARRDCLLSDGTGQGADGAVSADPPADGLDPETALLVRAAIEECRTTRAAQGLARDRVAGAQTRIAERLGLLDRKIALVLTRPNRADKRIAAEMSLSLALERNTLAAKHDTLQTEARALAIDHDRARLAAIRETGQEIADLVTRQARLAAALAAPRLTAPETGTIARIRPLQPGKAQSRDEPLIELRAPGNAAYVAEVSLTAAQAARITTGTHVRLTLMGFPDPAPTLTGTVSALTDATSLTGQTRTTARITLSDQSLKDLANPENGIALNGKNTASIITIQTQATKLKSKIKTTAQKMIKSNKTQK